MRPIIIVVLALFGFFSVNDPLRAQQSNDCKRCSEQQQACMKNYPAKTCKTEYDICIKSCRQK